MKRGRIIQSLERAAKDGPYERYVSQPVLKEAIRLIRKVPYQTRVWRWVTTAFPLGYCTSRLQRNQRFLEEALELVQANGCSRSEAHQLVDYVFDRPIGEIAQEVGGVRVTLSGLCTVAGIDEELAAETELTRINNPSVIDKIRSKQRVKPEITG